MDNFECSFGIKSKSWKHQSWILKFSLHFLFKNHLKWSSVEGDTMLRIWSFNLSSCPATRHVTRAPGQVFHQTVHGHAFTTFFLFELLIILKSFQHEISRYMCEVQFCFRKFFKITPTF